MYFLVYWGVANTGFGWIVRVIGWASVVLITYIVSIIKSFFRKFWFEMYNKVVDSEEKEETEEVEEE
jgi:hypothetical protein